MKKENDFKREGLEKALLKEYLTQSTAKIGEKYQHMIKPLGAGRFIIMITFAKRERVGKQAWILVQWYQNHQTTIKELL